jgi:hypothetical protein
MEASSGTCDLGVYPHHSLRDGIDSTFLGRSWSPTVTFTPPHKESITKLISGRVYVYHGISLVLLSILSYPASFTTVTNHPLIVTILILITLIISSAIEVIMFFCRLHNATSQYSRIAPRRPLLLVLSLPFLRYLHPAMLAADFISQ